MRDARWSVLLLAAIAGCSDTNQPTNPAPMTLAMVAGSTATAAVGDAVIMFTWYDSPPVGTKYHLTTATGPSACVASAPPEATLIYPMWAVALAGETGAGQPVAYYTDRPLVPGTELTYVELVTSGIQ